MNDFPADDMEFRQCWSSTAGKLAGIKETIVLVENKSAQAFIRKRDDVANALRDLATELGIIRDDLSKKVQGYIDEDKRRNFERTKMLRH